MTYSPNNKTITDLIEWALNHGYNPYTSITSLPERRDRLYKAYIEVSNQELLTREREISKTYADRSFAALKYLSELIDGDSPMDSEITTVIRILEEGK
jgi:hypothetical protein